MYSLVPESWSCEITSQYDKKLEKYTHVRVLVNKLQYPAAVSQYHRTGMSLEKCGIR